MQTATNPADPATYSEPVMVSKSKITFANKPPGSTIDVRVLTLDAKQPTGKSEYTPWVSVIVAV